MCQFFELGSKSLRNLPRRIKLENESSHGLLGNRAPLILVLAMIGGGTIPVAFMPGFLRTAGNISPFTWAVRAIEGALWRGYTPADMLLPCGILLAFGAKGMPTVVMAIVFAGAPIVNAVAATLMHPPKGGFAAIPWQFYLGIVLAASGGCLVSYYKPTPAPKAAKAPATAPALAKN